MTTRPWGGLPVSRINTIMKSCSEVESLGKESIVMMAKATELFIKKLAREGHDLGVNRKRLDYRSVAEIVNTHEKYEFLREIMPRKITFAEYKRIVGIEDVEEESDDSSNSDSSSEDSSGSQ